jgi:uncharacterized membrane protein YheB (UPF0754 family)
MTYWLFIIPFISAFIGWGIHRIAVKWFLYRWLPKNQQMLAEKSAGLVRAELATLNLQQKISDPSHLDKVLPMIEAHVDDFLRNKLKAQMPVISMFVGDKTIQSMKTIFMQEIQTLFPQVMKQFAGNLEENLNIEQTVINKVNAVSPGRIEKSLIKQIRWISLAGALTGFLIGLIQIIITILINS